MCGFAVTKKTVTQLDLAQLIKVEMKLKVVFVVGF